MGGIPDGRKKGGEGGAPLIGIKGTTTTMIRENAGQHSSADKRNKPNSINGKGQRLKEDSSLELDWQIVWKGETSGRTRKAADHHSRKRACQTRGGKSTRGQWGAEQRV